MNLQAPYSMSLRFRIRTILPLMALGLLCAGRASAQSGLKVVLPECGHPHLACTAEELGRLRQAYRGQGAEHDVVAAYVTDAERFIADPISFPPRGGQHNQWYQCDKCQIALHTIDATHHQCPKCKKVYSGPPYDDVIFAHEHSRNLQRMVTAAWAYAISGERRFAEYAARVLLGYAERYSQYPYHDNSLKTDTTKMSGSGGHLFEQTLNEAASMATRIGPAYDLIHDGDALSAAEHHKIREDLLLPILRNIDKNKAGKSNWQTWHNAAMLWGGALVHDPNWVRKAITDERNGFYYQMNVSVSKEGMWYENSWGYHFYTLSALIEMAETARRLGLDLWGHERLKKDVHAAGLLLDGRWGAPAVRGRCQFIRQTGRSHVRACLPCLPRPAASAAPGQQAEFRERPPGAAHSNLRRVACVAEHGFRRRGARRVSWFARDLRIGT